MRSILTVSTAATVRALTTLARVKSELQITNNEKDEIITTRISEASTTLETYLRRVLARETVVETIRLQAGDGAAECLNLKRWPVASITSIMEDDVAVDSEEYELEPAAGIIYRLDASGYRSSWFFCKSIILTYVAGYLLPAETSRDLPADIELAAVKLVTGQHLSSGRDPLVKMEEIPGVMRQEFWVGSIPDASSLPPDVTALVEPYRRPI
jgi:hypothetical protein